MTTNGALLFLGGIVAGAVLGLVVFALIAGGNQYRDDDERSDF